LISALAVLDCGCGTNAATGLDHPLADASDAQDAADAMSDAGSGLEPTQPDSLRPACGNGVLDPIEMCDDGNTLADDGCTRLCQIESGYACPVVGKPCQRIDGGQDSD
jgi:cysteine-rich repeat protein